MVVLRSAGPRHSRRAGPSGVVCSRHPDRGSTKASSDAEAIHDAALDSLSSDLTPLVARRISQIAIDRLRRLVAETGASPERTEFMQARTEVETAYRAYVAAHPTGREKVAALERQRAAMVRREWSPSRS